MGVSVGGNNFKNSVVDGQERDIEGTTAEIEDENVLLSFLLVHAVGDGSSGRFVDDSHDDETSDNSGILGSLTLSIVEVLNKKIKN